MAVKASGTAAKALSVLDAVARLQPIGVSALARHLGEDKSMVQRMLVTLAQQGWIRPERDTATKWRATMRLRLLADLACPQADLRSLARPVMEELRDRTGETISLVALDNDRIIVLDVAESKALLRAVPTIGLEVPGPVSASSLAALPWLSRTEQIALLREEPGLQIQQQIEDVRAEGYAILESERGGGTVSIAAPIFNDHGALAAVLVLSAPVARLSPPYRDAIGSEIANAATAIVCA
ncbi:MAG: IclR family transcriptional regulator [Novosphingobium sp.]|nr:IclR family transcriptional regulator [Novosphingobium sp.]